MEFLLVVPSENDNYIGWMSSNNFALWEGIIRQPDKLHCIMCIWSCCESEPIFKFWVKFDWNICKEAEIFKEIYYISIFIYKICKSIELAKVL